MNHLASRTADDGYAALASLYDEFVAHPGYRRWVLEIERTARDVGVRGVRLLDLGCGTGRSFAPLLGRGYLITGCEPVSAMLEQARRRSPRRVRTVCALAGDAPRGRFDLVLALNDVVHCIPDDAELRRTLGAIAGRLAPDGVFAFDVTPPDTHAQLFGRRSERRTARAHFTWEPRPAAAGTHLAELRVQPARQPAATTVHRQRELPEASLHRALAAAGLRVAAVRGCDNSGRVGPVAPGAFKHLYFTQLSVPPRSREEVLDAQGPQAAYEGRGDAVGRQDRLIAVRGAASVAPRRTLAGGGR